MTNWEELHRRCMSCQKCALADTRTNVVFGTFLEGASVMKIDAEMVDYIARLSRLELQPGEKRAMTEELERIVAYMDVLDVHAEQLHGQPLHRLLQMPEGRVPQPQVHTGSQRQRAGGRPVSGHRVQLVDGHAVAHDDAGRWGRSEECFGEDPVLAAAFAGAVVRGYRSQGVDVTAKHLCAQGETTGGVNASAAPSSSSAGDHEAAEARPTGSRQPSRA